MESVNKTYTTREKNAIRLINNVLYQLNNFPVTETFGESFFDLLSTINKLSFEANGTIMDLFKSSTPLSPQLIDDFIAGKLTERYRNKVLEIIFYSASSSYMDARYLTKLRNHGYLEITDEAIEEFKQVITSLRDTDIVERKNLIDKVKKAMDGLSTVEPEPVIRNYNRVELVVKKYKGKSIIYFSPEMKLIGGPRSIFSGGLGVLAGEYIEGLADIGIETYGITLLYKKSIAQKISPYNISTTEEIFIDYNKLPVFDTGIIIEENIMGIPVRAKVWEINAGPARIFALEDLTSDITDMLYGGEKETSHLREQQNQLLGRGGIKAIEELYRLNIIDKKPGIIHLNEANCYCALDEVQRKQMFPQLDNLKIWQNVGTAFTTHTPVPAGLPMIYSQSFGTSDIIHLSWLLNSDPITLMMFYVSYLGDKSWDTLDSNKKELLISLLESGNLNHFITEFKKVAGDNIVLNLTEGTAALCDGSTSVSLRHEQVSNSEIIKNSKNSPCRHGRTNQATTGITNGVNIRDWQPPEFQGFDLNNISAELLLSVKRHEKEEFIEMVNKRTGSRLSPEFLTISIMRRINTYKRTDLIIREIDILVEELGDQEINIVFSGIPHGKDMPAQAIFKKILEAVNWKHPNIHVAFICQYDVSIAKYAVRGSDIWLMQPIEKKEASSTSHQKALGAATLVVSTYDGAMIENVVDVDINHEKANGAFITPLIIYRIFNKSDNRFRFITPYTVEGNGRHGFFSKPVVCIDNGKNYTPIAVMEKKDRFVVVDDIISDLSVENLHNFLKNPPDYLIESPIKNILEKSILGSDKISDENFHALMYETLDPFSTSDLHYLYDYNPQPWYRLLYRKVGKLAKIYSGVKYGHPKYGAQWVTMMKNAILRTYEVDIHRMAAEYIRDIYDHISKRKRKQILESFGDQKLENIAKKWREQFLKAKLEEYDKNLSVRLTQGYLDDKIGTFVEDVKIIEIEPIIVEADINIGWVTQPEDFEIELHYGDSNCIPMTLQKAYSTIKKRYCYRGVLPESIKTTEKIEVAIKPKNEKIASFLKFIRDNKNNGKLSPEIQADILKLNSVIDSLDKEGRRWFMRKPKIFKEKTLSFK